MAEVVAKEVVESANRRSRRKLPWRVEQMTEIAFVEAVVSSAAYVSSSVYPITLLFAVSFRPRRNCPGFIGPTPLPAQGMRETLFAPTSWQHWLHSFGPFYSTITLHRAILTYVAPLHGLTMITALYCSFLPSARFHVPVSLDGLAVIQFPSFFTDSNLY